MSDVIAKDITLAPEVVLPAQFFVVSPGGIEQPEKRLMLAVLVDALSTLRRGTRGKGMSARRQVREVRAWCWSRDLEWPYSYENICAVLGIDADALRVWVRRVQEERRSPATPAPSLPMSGRMAGHRHRVTLRRSERARAASG